MDFLLKKRAIPVQSDSAAERDKASPTSAASAGGCGDQYTFSSSIASNASSSADIMFTSTMGMKSDDIFLQRHRRTTLQEANCTSHMTSSLASQKMVQSMDYRKSQGDSNTILSSTMFSPRFSTTISPKSSIDCQRYYPAGFMNGGNDFLSMNRSKNGRNTTFFTDERPSTTMEKSTMDPIDLAIEATLQKTMETFQRMVDERRAELVQMFPQLANVRCSPSPPPPPTEEMITERKVQPDGSILEVRSYRSRRFTSVQKATNIIDGEVVVRSRKTRAIIEYEGPGGGYRLKLVEQQGGPAATGENEGLYDYEDAQSENEEEDEDAGDRTSTVPSEISDTESLVVFAPNAPELIREPKQKKGKTDKAWFAAKELVDSERRYVEKLRLLDQFRNRMKTDSDLFKSIGGGKKLEKLFSNVSTLYQFHKDHLLPELEERIGEWKETQKICDVMRRQAPFLKMYSAYTSNYGTAIKTFEDLKKSNKKYASVVNEIEKLPECDLLPLSNHLICPVQRVTRYHLLMTEYLKNLGDCHPDKEDTKQALELAKEAASHSNRIMSQLDKYKDVIEVQEMLGSQVPDLLTPSRELIKKGRLMKISARNGEHHTRFAFLFNDMLLICSEHRNVITSSLSGKFKLRALFEVDGMQVLEGDNLDIENTFYVRSGNKIVELYTEKMKEKVEWMESLWSVIQDYKERMQSFRKPEEKEPVSPTCSLEKPSSPRSAEACSNCNSVFNAFKKCYLCKSCGASLCKKCSQKKVKLHEDDKKKQRVCAKCYECLKKAVGAAKDCDEVLVKNGDSKNAAPPSSPNAETEIEKSMISLSRRNILEVKPSDPAIWSGYLDMKTVNRKTWDRRYFCLQQDLVLYSFTSDKAECAKTSMPISGCRICFIDPRNNNDPSCSAKMANAFKLEHARRLYYLKAGGPEEIAKCVAAMELASQAQLSALGA